MKPTLALALALLLVAFSAQAQSVDAPGSPATGVATAPSDALRIRLSELIARLRARHPLLEAGRARVRGARSTAVGAGLWSNPVLDVSHTLALRRSTYDPIGAPVAGVTQFLELSGAPRARRRAAELEAAATEADLAALERALISDLTLAYLDYVTTLERIRVYQAHGRELERIERLVKVRIEGGLAPLYDGTRLAVARVEHQALMNVAQADLLRAHGALAVAAGTEIAPAGTEADLDLDAPLPQLAVRAPASNPWALAARRRAEAASASVNAAERAVWPGLGVRLGGGYGQGPGQIDLGLGLIIPLPLLDRGQGALPAARARAEEAHAEQRAVDRALRQQQETALAEYRRRISVLEAFRKESKGLLGPLQEQAEVGYRDGRLSVFELLEAYQTVRETRLRIVELASMAQVARVNAERLGGPVLGANF